MDSLIEFLGRYLFLAAPGLLVFAWLRQNPVNKRSLALRALAAAILSVAFAYIVGSAHYSVRPFVRLHETPLISHVADNGMPSDHTLVAAVCAALLFAYALPEAIAASVITVIVAWARVASLLHSPLDVVASIILAAAAAGIARVLVRRKPKTGRTASGRTQAQLAESRASKARSSI